MCYYFLLYVFLILLGIEFGSFNLNANPFFKKVVNASYSKYFVHQVSSLFYLVFVSMFLIYFFFVLCVGTLAHLYFNALEHGEH